MDLIAWVVGIALLGVGLYRLWLEGDRAGRLQRRSVEQSPREGDTKRVKAAPVETPTTSADGLEEQANVDPEHDDDITIVTLRPAAFGASPRPNAKIPAPASVPDAPLEQGPAPIAAGALMPPEDEEDEGREASPASAVPILYDDDASVDEPTRNMPWILMSAAAQTDRGRRRRRNEDSVLALEDHHLFVVADGMGGHAGGDVASKMAVDIIGEAFTSGSFGDTEPYAGIPERGAELALAIQLANKAIFDHARANAAYKGMGTTVVSARFSPHKQRVYFGHVGDSRCYRLRGGTLTQVTTDHTMGAEGITGPLANHLNRAVGIHAGVKVDLIIARPLPDDVYLLCSDGLSKMVPDDIIRSVLAEEADADKAVSQLIEQANQRGGRDNITVVVVQVRDAEGIARIARAAEG